MITSKEWNRAKANVEYFVYCDVDLSDMFMQKGGGNLYHIRDGISLIITFECHTQSMANRIFNRLVEYYKDKCMARLIGAL